VMRPGGIYMVEECVEVLGLDRNEVDEVIKEG
jgi:hypothetical protein